MAAAGRLRDTLDLPDDEPVDIFDVIRTVGVWLSFQPMDKLLGATLSAGSGGIMVTTRRDVAMQRFTAAHELGHHTLHRDEDVWDFEQDVDADPSDAKEQEANAFAANFLLPRPLLNRRLRDYGVTRTSDVPASVVYLISRDLGLSYAATVSRVAEVKDLHPRERERLQGARPIDIKRDLLSGREPENRRAQVWLPAERTKPSFTVDVGDEMFADLPENPSTGYRWTRAGIDPQDDAPVTVLEDEFAPASDRQLGRGPAENIVGAQGSRQLHLRAESEGEWMEQLTLRRPFEPEDRSLETVELRAVVRPRPETLSSRFNTQLPELDAE
jgi:predicted secreted protein